MRYRVEDIICRRRTKEEIENRIIDIPELPEGAIIVGVLEVGMGYPIIRVLVPVEEEEEVTNL